MLADWGGAGGVYCRQIIMTLCAPMRRTLAHPHTRMLEHTDAYLIARACASPSPCPHALACGHDRALPPPPSHLRLLPPLPPTLIWPRACLPMMHTLCPSMNPHFHGDKPSHLPVHSPSHLQVPGRARECGGQDEARVPRAGARGDDASNGAQHCPRCAVSSSSPVGALLARLSPCLLACLIACSFGACLHVCLSGCCKGCGIVAAVHVELAEARYLLGAAWGVSPLISSSVDSAPPSALL